LTVLLVIFGCKEELRVDAKTYNTHQIERNLLSGDHIIHLVKFWQEAHDLKADGYAGPQTQESLDEAVFGTSHKPSSLAARALEVAIEELGNGEEGGNNSGQHIARYKGIPDDGDPDDDGAWCASFVSYCFDTAADSLGVSLPFKTSHGAKALYKRISEAGTKVSFPIPGDVVCWDRGKPGSWQGHIGIVTKFEDGVIHTIEGNVGRFPSLVQRLRHDIDMQPRLIGFGRI
jgi:hypothetical protein